MGDALRESKGGGKEEESLLSLQSPLALPESAPAHLLGRESPAILLGSP